MDNFFLENFNLDPHCEKNKKHVGSMILLKKYVSILVMSRLTINDQELI